MSLLSLARRALTGRMWLLCLTFILATSTEAFGASVLIVDKPGNASLSRQQLEEAAQFYGLTSSTIMPTGNKEFISALHARGGHILAVAIHANALSLLDEVSVTSALRTGEGQTLPLLIFGIDEHTDPLLLRHWSEGAIIRCSKRTWEGDHPASEWFQNDVAAQLKGSYLPVEAKEAPYFVPATATTSESIIQVNVQDVHLPVFIRVANGTQETFFSTAMQVMPAPLSPSPYRQQSVFASLAPYLIFLRSVAGTYAWHSPAAYANFTIDDLWLRSTYGHVDYRSLLREAKQHNFHTTIAFIPWNFDRSQPEVSDLFRKNQDRYSICVHGNNHVHQEFGPLASHPMDRQAFDVTQALARMEKFSELTQIPYDPVMVFPHSVSPEATFAALKNANYLATANSLNVPSDGNAPSGAEFALRTATLKFADFPSLRRYSTETDIPEAQLAIDAFLGNPMLFYAHESFFSGGIDAFDKTADTVNRIQPTTQWRGLADIVHHLYLEKLRDDGAYDIQAFSSSIQLQNSHQEDAVFYVTKDENFTSPPTLSIDGESQPYVRLASGIGVKVLIRAGATRNISVKYGPNADLGRVDISKPSLKVNGIRALSDFRDNVVSNSWLGRKFIRSYADRGSAWNAFFVVLFIGCISSLLCVSFVRRSKRQANHSYYVDRAKAG